ncbi:DNA/RNA polymerases superfamily protein [Gossypium australe]|uniref:DNA/RNA polymerases superfamily protein n=1 Tax=Gossypium australe TaxID=47621 RepID=A0A5B6WTI1_9ROSI|nr:DNA/RNA polymerases superfamily protein [Gossypium australe]
MKPNKGFISHLGPLSLGQSRILLVELHDVIRIISDMMQSCVMEFAMGWEHYLPLAEFAYNNSDHTSIQMAPSKALYRRRCCTLLCWEWIAERKAVGLELVRDTEDKLSPRFIRPYEIEERVGLVAYRLKLPYKLWKINDVFHKVLPSGRKGKLSLQFIRPYEIIERIGPIAYRLALPLELEKIHNVFHVSMLRWYRSDPLHVISPTDVEI